MKLAPGEMPLMITLVRQLAGVHLDESKGYLIENRLGPIAKRIGCTNFNELYFKLRYDAKSTLVQEVVDAITTHETSWFRDGAPYDALQFKVAPECIDARSRSGSPRKLRIWSAACSTGQEPYGIAMVLSEMLPDIASWDIQILATDISKSSIDTAIAGVYSPNDVGRTQRPNAMQRWFDQTPMGAVVKPAIKKLVTFRQLNLMDPLLGIGPFDVVFLRNVLIYFDKATKLGVLQRIKNVLMPHGWLFVGGTENLGEAGPEWVPQTHCRATVYQPNVPVRV
ncbi:MAG: protein-glutamate O-methyltransferase CheR [Planctomycetes bacterium]|nr:protein-glutamate O-methyltransferase CheR [Planctomycetota bacterium]